MLRKQALVASNAVARDQAERLKTTPSWGALLHHAAKSSGRKPLDLAREFFRLHRGRGRLTFPEYVQYGVYDTKRHSPEDQSRFISRVLHWPITYVCSDMSWRATTEDKWLCSHILERSTIRIPKTLGIIDRTDRAYPGARKISTAAELRDFLTSREAGPLFGKENRGICSLGAFQTLDADDQGLLMKGRDRVGYEEFLDRFTGATPYLLQELQKNHPFFDAYTDSLATIRVCILVTEEGVKFPFAVLKLPASGNIADSFWREGNLACKLDVESGRMLTVRSKVQLGTTDHDVHPETGAPMLGETLPHWDAVLELARNCAEIFAPVRYQSMDIAVTPDGPVLIEVNTGGGFDLPQLATGEGFLTDEVRDFFRACGWKKS